MRCFIYCIFSNLLHFLENPYFHTDEFHGIDILVVIILFSFDLNDIIKKYLK